MVVVDRVTAMLRIDYIVCDGGVTAVAVDSIKLASCCSKLREVSDAFDQIQVIDVHIQPLMLNHSINESI